jgi:hypothetical protein
VSPFVRRVIFQNAPIPGIYVSPSARKRERWGRGGREAYRSVRLSLSLSLSLSLWSRIARWRDRKT